MASPCDGVSPRNDHHTSDGTIRLQFLLLCWLSREIDTITGKAKKQDESRKYNDDNHDRNKKERSPPRRDKDEKRDKDDKKEVASPRHERPAHRSPRREDEKASRSKERSPSRKDDSHDKDRAKRVSVATSSSSKDKESRESRDEKRVSSSARDKERLDRDRERDTDKRQSKYGSSFDFCFFCHDRVLISA